MFRLRFSNAEIRKVTELIRMGVEAPVWLEDGPELRRWLHGADPSQLPSFARIWMATARLDRLRWGRTHDPVIELLGRLRAEARSGAPIRSRDLALDGRDLISMGLKPSPRFREIFEVLMDRVLEDPRLNRPELLKEMAMALVQGGEEDGP